MPAGLLPGLLLSSGCSGEPSTGEPTAAIAIADVNNYTSQASLTIPNLETAEGVDLDICWDDVTSSLRCHDLDPIADLDNVGLLRLNDPQDEVEQKLVSGQLLQSDINGYLEYNTDQQGTCTKLSAFNLFGTEVPVVEQYVESSSLTYMLLFSTGTTAGVGAQAMLFLTPSSSSTNTTVAGQPGCGTLDFMADLASAEPVSMPANGPFAITWENLEHDSLGQPIVARKIDQLLIGFYQDMTVAQIEDQIFDLELMATTLWDLELTGGSSANLEHAVERGTNVPFTGFERNDGTWLLALLCSTCQNPAPVLLTVLEPGGQT